MTEGNSTPVRYLDRGDIEKIHAILVAWSRESGEPVPSLAFADWSAIDALVQTPRQSFGGQEAYPTITEKAAILFYTINKRQMFANGNKRMSTLCLLVFLAVNDFELTATADELTEKALWLAQTESLDFPQIKADLVSWINDSLSKQKATKNL